MSHVDLVAQLRTLMAAVDPALLSADDRLALLDLFERASVRDSSAA